MSVRARRGAASYRRGQWAELLCLWALRLKGYRILAQRYRTPVGEIDLIARRGHTIAAIEVKARPDDVRAAEAVLWKQRSRVARALEHFVQGRPDLAGAALRFDVMLVTPRRWPRHLRGAWRVGD